MVRKKAVNIINLKNLSMIAAFVALLYLIWQLSSLLILVITAAILATTFHPLVKVLSKKLNERFAAALVVITLAVPVILSIVLVVPVFLNQIDNIANALTKIVNDYPFLPKFFQDINISQYTESAGNYIWISTKAFTNFFAQLIILIFMVYYLLVDSEEIKKFAMFFVPTKSKKEAGEILYSISEISGQYIRGNIFISFICYFVIFSGLWLLKVPGAGALAILAAIFDLLPLIGATIASVPAIILAFTVSPLTGLLTIGLFWLYQEFENNIVIPRVYHETLKIIPFFSFVAVIIGTMLFGIMGAFLALPIAASVPTIVNIFIKKKTKKKPLVK